MRSLTTLLSALLLSIALSSATAQPVTDAQGDVGIGTVTPDPSAILELRSTTKGFLTPQMTTAMRDAIVSPATGLLLFNTDADEYQYNFGTPGSPDWTRVVTDNSLSDNVWMLEGNVGTNPFDGVAGDFLGTTDDVDLVIAAGNTEQGRFYSPGNGGGFGITGPFLLNGTAGTGGQVLISQGVGAAPAWTSDLTLDNLTVTNDVVVDNDLTVNGDAVFNGVVNFFTMPIIPLAQGGLLVGNASNQAETLPAGTTGQVLQINGGGSPSWQTVNLLPTGSTPNSILVWDGTAWIENTNVTSDPSTGNTTINGDLTVNGGVTLPPGSVDNSELANSTINVSYGTGLSGDASVALGGTLSLQNTGVTSVTGTANQVNVSGTTGGVTLSLPQDIDVNATPRFDGVILDNLSGGSTSTEIVTSNAGTLETRSINSLIGASTLTEHSLWVGGALNTPTELAAGTTGQVLGIDAAGSPSWQTVNLLPSGSTPNSILVWDGTTWVENTNVTSDPSTGNTTINGDLTVNGGVTLLPGSVDNSELANSTINVSYGTGLSGDASVALGGTLSLQNTGVTSVTGTANQVNVSGATGGVTLSLPQDIDVNATPRFDGVILDNLSGGSTSTEIVTSNAGTLETRSINSLIGASTLTEHSLWVGGALNTPTELAAGTTGQVLGIAAAGSPAWQTVNLLPTGSTPNSILVWSGTAWVENTNVTSDPSTGNTTINGNLTVNGGVTLPPGSVDNSELANSTINVSYGTGLSGDASVALGGTLSLQNTGVTSVTGTANQVNVSGTTGGVTLSLPQDIDVNATPRFDGVILDNLSGGSTSTEIVTSNGGTLETRSINSLIGASTLTEHSLWVGGALNTPTELAAGATGQVLGIAATGSPAWQAVNILPVGSTPNSILVWDGTTWAENTNVTSDPSTGNTTINGNLTVNGGVTLPPGSVDNSELANSTINVSYGTGLSGDASVALGGTLSLQNTGVTSVTGTANQVNVSGTTGGVTLSLPQDIDVNATPRFDGVILDNLSGGSTSTEIVTSNAGTLETRSINSLIGASTLTENNIWVGDAGNNPSQLPPGSEGNVLTIVGGVPMWGAVTLTSTDVTSASTTDETFAVRGTASGSTTNQVAGIWGRATDPSAGNTGTIGVFATGNGNTTAGQTNAALQLNDGEIRMGRTTETGTGYTVVEGATGGTNYTAQGPSGVIELNLTLANSSPLLGTVVGVLNTLGTPLGAPTLGTTLNNLLGTSVFNTTITINNRYVSPESIVLTQVVDIDDTDLLTDLITLFQNGTLAASTAVSNRQTGSFDLTIDLHAIGTVPAISSGTIRVGYVVINPSR